MASGLTTSSEKQKESEQDLSGFSDPAPAKQQRSQLLTSSPVKQPAGPSTPPDLSGNEDEQRSELFSSTTRKKPAPQPAALRSPKQPVSGGSQAVPKSTSKSPDSQAVPQAQAKPNSSAVSNKVRPMQPS